MAELKEALTAKTCEAENLKGEAVEQYAKGFDEAIKQFKFLYIDLDIFSCGYFKEVQDRKLVDKLLPGANATEIKGGDQMGTPDDAAPLTNRDKDQVHDSLAAT